MDLRRKPTVISLRKHLHDSSKTTTTFIRHAGPEAEPPLCVAHPTESWPTPESLSMISELDEEMANDFKWLIDFDLHSVFLHDIDGDNSEAEDNRGMNGVLYGEKNHLSDLKESFLQKKGRTQAFKQDISQNLRAKKFVPYTYNEMIIQCIDEIGAASVKNIYKWISDTFPDFEPTDITWKNAVRHTLTVNPLFQKKKSDFGKCHVWYLDKSSSTSGQKKILQPFKFENIANPEHQKSKQRRSKKLSANKDRSISKKMFVLNAENINYSHGCTASSANGTEDNADNYEQKYNTENWLVTNPEFNDGRNLDQMVEVVDASKNGSDDYYTLEIPLTSEFLVDSANYTEPIEVRCLLDENAASIPVQIIQGK